MTDEEVVRDLARTTTLIGVGADDEARLQNAATFTRYAAWALRDRLWGNLRKTTGVRVRDLSADTLIHRTTGELRDIVFGKATPDAAVQWLYQGIDDPARYVAPVAPNDTPPPPPPPSPDLDVRVRRLEDRYAAGVETLGRLIEYLDGLLAELRASG